MSHLIEEYSKSLGVRISKPIVSRHFYPVMFDNYITIQLAADISAKKYHYYEIVIDLISSQLRKLGIAIVQVGATPETKLKNVNISYGKLNFKNTAYIVSKSKLHIGVDDSLSHYVNSLNIPQVTLFANVYSSVTEGYWSKSKINIEAPWTVKPCLSNHDPEDSINKILPETIASAILKSLKADDKIPLKTLFTGKMYHNKIVEIVPDFTSGEDFMKERSINLRLDYVKNLNVSIFNYWMSNRKVNIITDKDININIIAPHKNRVLLMTIMMSPNISERFLKHCKTIGLKLKIFCDDKNKLNEYKFKFLDWDINKDFENDSALEKLPTISEKSKFISSKILISKGKQFSCKANYLLNKHLDNSEENVILSREFEKEIEFFKIYNEREESTTSSSIA
jgi:hypothetical protein